ncbi:hypothetical protein ACFQV2_06500 [Actinokineospora soli]|uniref:Uncharacterized protein n=1 Tax=Actinokineospora soli TaxID=1048753 RepID=A0ABW2TJB2_9PSEU
MDPILVDIAAALATKSAASLYDLVRGKFADGGREADALEAAEGAEPGSPEVTALAEELERAEAADPDFATALRAEWNAGQVREVVDRGSVSNKATGTFTGPVIQAKNIGDITFGG